MNIEALKEAHDLSLDGRDFAARQIILDVIADLEKKEPAGYADKIAFESAMKVGKGCDVWPVKGDYEARTGRALIALYTSPPPQRKPLTDEEERKAFEDYAVRTICNPVELQRERLGGYSLQELNYLWRGWKARAAHGIKENT